MRLISKERCEKGGDYVQDIQGMKVADVVDVDDIIEHSQVQSSQVQDSKVQDSQAQNKTNVIQSILLVDPDPDFSSTVSDYLKLFGYHICFRTSIDEALDYVKANNTDVIFLGDGFEYQHPIDVLRRLKDVLPSAMVAILANNGDDQLAAELLKAGADDYLSRRVKDKDILTSIVSLLDRLTSDGPANTQRQFYARQLRHSPRDVSTHNQADRYSIGTSKKGIDQKFTQTNLNICQITESMRVFELLPNAIMFLDKSLQIININQQCLKLLGYRLSQLINQPIQPFLPNDFYLELVSEIDKADSAKERNGLSTNKNKVFELLITNSDEVNIPVRCQIGRVNPADVQSVLSVRIDQAVGYILTIEDMSDEKAKQAKLLYHKMWGNLQRVFAQRFINLTLENFSDAISAVVSESAIFLRLDRVSIFLIDKEKSTAKIYLEWLKGRAESLKTFAKKLEIQQHLPEFSRLLNGEVQFIKPECTTKKFSISQRADLSEYYAQVGALSSAIIPIAKQKKVIGWISLDYQTRGNYWQNEDLILVKSFGQLIFEAFVRRAQEAQRKVTHQKLSENHGRLSEQAFLDGLTNLANRRYFDKVLESEVRRASRDKTNIAILFCDVDCFKSYNDTYGHIDGDRCLRSIAAVLQNEFQRAGDFVARFGGEEFAVILCGMLTSDVQDAAEKLRNQILAMKVEHQGSPIGQITISIGVCSSISPAPTDAQKLLAQADKALYKAKSKGKNRVETSRLIRD